MSLMNLKAKIMKMIFLRNLVMDLNLVYLAREVVFLWASVRFMSYQ